MKAVITEIRGKYAAVLSEDGCISKVTNKNYAVGQVVIMDKLKKSISKLALRLGSAAAAVAVLGTSAWAYYTPCTYVSLDVNPSIEYKLNMFDRVISCNAVNSDGEKVLSGLELQNKEIGDAIDITIKKINVSGYFSEGDSLAIEITVNNKDEEKTEKLADELKDRAEEETKEEGHKAVTVEAEGVGAARVKEAKALGVTPGKLNLVQKLQASNPGVKIDQAEWLKKPVKDIMKQIKENKKAKKASDKADKKGDSEKDAEKPSKSPAKPPKAEIKDSKDKKAENKDKNIKTPASAEKAKAKGNGGEKSSNGNKSK